MPSTVAVKVCVLFVCTFEFVGLTATVTSVNKVTFADPLTEASAWETAEIVTVAGVGRVAGDV